MTPPNYEVGDTVVAISQDVIPQSGVVQSIEQLDGVYTLTFVGLRGNALCANYVGAADLSKEDM